MCKSYIFTIATANTQDEMNIILSSRAEYDNRSQ